MPRYYTRACNFYFGKQSKILVNKKQSIPLHQIKAISFDHVEIITRKTIRKISINNIKNLPKKLKTKINSDLKKISSKKSNFSNLNFKKIPNILGVLNLTPDSFSDGGKFNKKNKGISHAFNLYKKGASLISLTPILIPFSIIPDFLVSKDIGIFFTINFNIFLILFHSLFSFTGLDPGLVDSPPTSIIDAPLLYKLMA